MQYGARPHSGNLWAPLLLIVAGAIVGGLMLLVLRIAVTHSRATFFAWRARRRQIRAAATAERRARALMSELCPFGWRAQITLYEGATEQENGDPVRDSVALDWFELTERGTEPAIMRRVWAPTIGEALEAMVSDRRTDETLEQIELRASADGAFWPDF